MTGAGVEVGAVDTVIAKQLFADPGERRRPVHAKFIDLARTHVPALQNQAAIVQEVVVMEMREKRVSDVCGTLSTLYKPPVRVGSVVHDDHVVADFDHISRTGTLKRWRWRAGPQNGDFHNASPSACIPLTN